MSPIHKEKYILAKETYGHFTVDQNREKLESKKRGIKLTAWVQIVVGVVFIASVIILKQKNMFIFSFFALMLAGAGVHGLKVKYPKYDKQIWENIEKSWQGKGFDQNWFDIKFFEDHLKYLAGENIDEVSYTDFLRFYETENYFAAHFVTGDLILFNPDCNKEKIKEIINGYRKKGLEEAEAEAAAESVTEEIIEDMQEEIAEEILG